MVGFFKKREAAREAVESVVLDRITNLKCILERFDGFTDDSTYNGVPVYRMKNEMDALQYWLDNYNEE